MGSLLSAHPARTASVLMFGLDSGGKTTVLYKLHRGETVTTMPSTGVNVETVKHGSLSLTIWDIAGHDKVRAMWRHYSAEVDAVIYVVDSADQTRIARARTDLEALMAAPELAGVPVLLFANKQDLPNSMSVSEATDGLGLQTWTGRKWHIEGCAAASDGGDGLREGMDWLSEALS